MATSSLVCGNGHDEGTRTKARAGSNRNTLTDAGIVTGPSSVKPAMTKDGQLKSGCTTPRALPSNGTSRLKAKRTRTIQPMKPTSKNAKGLTCWKRFGLSALFAISGMSNVDSARSAIQQSPGSQDGAFITASPVSWVVPIVPRTVFYFITSDIHGFIDSDCLLHNCARPKAAIA